MHVTQDFHGLKLSLGWVLEAFLQHVVICLFHLTSPCLRFGLASDLFLEQLQVFSVSLGVQISPGYFLFDCFCSACLLFFDFDLKLLVSLLNLELFLLNPECVFTFGRQLLELNTLLKVYDGILESINPLGIVSDGSNLPGILSSLDFFKFVRQPVFMKISLDDQSFESRFLCILLTELSLHVLEESTGADPDISDFNSCEVNTPTFDDLSHFLEDSLTKALSVLDDFGDG